MLDKLLEAVPVRVYLLRVHCPNTSCDGVLQVTNKTRNETGETEYRHACSKCGAGYWLKDQYPKTKFEPIEDDDGD